MPTADFITCFADFLNKLLVLARDDEAFNSFMLEYLG
jgi:hypothetical protein